MKQAILIREDVDMSTGKTVAQGAHASVLAVRDADNETVQTWLNQNAGTKITLSVQSEKHLRGLIKEAEDNNLPTGII